MYSTFVWAGERRGQPPDQSHLALHLHSHLVLPDLFDERLAGEDADEVGGWEEQWMHGQSSPAPQNLIEDGGHKLERLNFSFGIRLGRDGWIRKSKYFSHPLSRNK